MFNNCETQAIAWEREQSALVDEIDKAVEEVQRSKLRFFTTEDDVKKEDLIGSPEIEMAIELGWGVELDKEAGALTVLAYPEIMGKPRGIHVRLLKRRGVWYVARAYYPDAEVWGRNLDKKICFCKGSRIERMVM